MMTKQILRLLLWVAISLFAGITHGAKSPNKVLFIGNSFSFYNEGVHNHYRSLLRANGSWQSQTNRTRLMTISGGHIHEHLAGLEAYLASDKRGWDVVVLQGHSNEAVQAEKRVRFDKALGEAINLVKQHDLQPLLFMTWGYKGDLAMASKIAEAYTKQGEKHHVDVVPVGLAFAAAEKQLPEIELFVPDFLWVKTTDNGPQIQYRNDVKHPSLAGTYLAACVFYASLQSSSPEGNLFHAELTADTALKLQRLSWQIVSEYQQGKKHAF